MPDRADDAEPRAPSETHEETRNDRPSRPSLRQPAVGPDFGPRYRVLGAIGKGGMGEVFRAYDTELKTEVALKIVRGDSDQEAALARFRREIALARKVTSANVLRVYDLAEHDGLRFLSMELVDGEDLGALMRRDSRMPLSRALKLFRQVCAGLEAAHAEGVVHRDLKPQNVLVDKDDRVRVADFGLARSIGESGLTASGAQLGSPAYMSPEQVKGDPVDERSDVYSLGIMLYQLVAGKPPFEADTPHAVMEMRLHKPPRPLREAAPELPAYLDAILRRCLAIDPRKRYATVRELLADLDAGRGGTVRGRRAWPFAAAAVVVAGAGIAIVARMGTGDRAAPVSAPPLPVQAAKPAATPTGQIKVLVLGISNRTGDPQLDGFELIVEEALRRSRLLDPLGGNQLEALAAELGPKPLPLDDRFGAVLAGRRGQRVVTVRGSALADGANITLSLAATDATTGNSVYTGSVSAPLAAVVPTIGKLAAGLREALGDHVPAGEVDQTGVSPLLDADADYALGLRFHYTGDDEHALPYYRQAVARDPDFARAQAAIAVSAENLGRYVEAKAAYARAFALVDRMNERDRLKFLGDYYDTATGEIDRSIGAYRELLDIWPDDTPARVNIIVAYIDRREFTKAVEAGQTLARAHPRVEFAREILASAELQAGRVDQALTDVTALLHDFPHPDPTAYSLWIEAEELAGHSAEAHEGAAQIGRIDASLGATHLADLMCAEGRLAEASKILEAAIGDDHAHGREDVIEVKQEALAEVRMRRGDKAGALAAAAAVTREPAHLFGAARVQLEAGMPKLALATAAKLSTEIALEPRANGKLLEGEAARLRGQDDTAIAAMQAALRTDDIGIGHCMLGRTLLDAKRFAEAKAELDTCYARRGEISGAANDTSGLRNVPAMFYYRALAEDGLGDHAAAHADLETFLKWESHADPGAPLVDDARARLAR
ncbi:MAG TPA: protein kinase [Kofleriaceae bacterium]|nr:protein kinase [Kofleriaceae bacterium]